MTRLRLQSVHVRLAQDHTVFDCHVSPVTLANGNVQIEGVAEAWSVALQEVKIKHYVSKPLRQGKWIILLWFISCKVALSFPEMIVIYHFLHGSVKMTL